MISDRILLLSAAFGLVPIALSYGVVPGRSVSFLLGFPVEQTNLVHVFRAVMGLYLANAAFWVAGAMRPSLRVPALWSLFLFMAGLAAGRIVSIVLDGVPAPALIFYTVVELGFAVLAFMCLRRSR